MTDVGLVEWTDLERLAWRLPEKLTVSEWADRYRHLHPLTTAEPGPWRTARVPYMRAVMDSLTDPEVEQITCCMSTQVSKTEAALNMVGYSVDQEARPVIFVMPTEPLATRLLNRRIRPMFEASPKLAENVTGWTSDWKASGEVRFKRSMLYMGWAQSPATMAGNPCGVAFLDEADKCGRFSGREASPPDLIRERLRTFVGQRCFVITSTPTTRDGLITREFELSDQRRYYLPCPHCGRFQTLRWERVRFPEEVRDPSKVLREDLAEYLCEQCEKPISDGDKLAALELGVWCPKDGEILEDGTVIEPEVKNPNRGFHLWAAYSPWITFSEIAAKWLEAIESNDPAKLMNVVNSWFAETFEEKVEEPTKDAVTAAVCEYEEATIPDDVRVLVAGADVGKKEIHATLWGWGEDERAFLILERRLKTFDKLAELFLDGEFGDAKLRVRCMGIDCRYRTDEVFDLAREYPEIVRPFRGVERDDPLPFTTSRVDRNPTSGTPYRKSLLVWHVNVGQFKDQLSGFIRNGPGEHRRSFHVHNDPSPEFVRQMGSEQKVKQRNTKGDVRERWVVKPGAKANHFWDASVYAFAAASLIHVHRIGKQAPRRRRRRRPRSIGGTS